MVGEQYDANQSHGNEQSVFYVVASKCVTYHLLFRCMVIRFLNLRNTCTAHLSNNSWRKITVDTLRNEVVAKTEWK